VENEDPPEAPDRERAAGATNCCIDERYINYWRQRLEADRRKFISGFIIRD